MAGKKRLAFVCGIALCAAMLPAVTQQAPKASRPAARSHATRPQGSAQDWWKHAVFYEIYPRSFKDTNGDGVGDLKGITEKLDYLADLGVDALWITPFYPSPQVDFGYDISDYENVDPQFGTLADFDRLLGEAHRRGIKILMDMVLNHTSDQHPWFIESRSSRDNPKRDWYIWRDGRGGGNGKPGEPPTNWRSVFGGLTWTFDPKTGQWYYRYFYHQQPDLNWRNPAVEKAMFDQVRFWLKRGVDGFRLDAVDSLFEDPELHDNPVLPRLVAGSTTEHEQIEKYDKDLPEVHTELQRLRQVSDSFPGPPILVAETWPPKIEGLLKYYGPHNNEVQLPFNFFFLLVPKFEAAAFRSEVEETERVLAGRWTTRVLNNHDKIRAYTRYGDGEHDNEIAKILATMLLTLRGTPFLYYGEEIGMANNDPQTIEEVRDPVGRRYWPVDKGRDGERTPMQWDTTRNAGFTNGTPWLKIPASAASHNVATESADPSSVLNYYKALLYLRRSSSALLDGAYETIGHDPYVFAYARKSPKQTVVVALNMSAERQKLNLKQASGTSTRPAVLLGSRRKRGQIVEKSELDLEPFEAVILDVE